MLAEHDDLADAAVGGHADVDVRRHPHDEMADADGRVDMRRRLRVEGDAAEVDGHLADGEPVVATQLGAAHRLVGAVADAAAHRHVAQRGDRQHAGHGERDERGQACDRTADEPAQHATAGLTPPGEEQHAERHERDGASGPEAEADVPRRGDHEVEGGEDEEPADEQPGQTTVVLAFRSQRLAG